MVSVNPISGEICIASNLKIGYYGQHFEESLPNEQKPTEYLCAMNREVSIEQSHKYLSLFGLEPLYHSTKISALSGGQKARVKLASLGIMKPHCLILDEPTNHLDITTIQSLIMALNYYVGAIILVTHNFDVITSLKSELWCIENNTIHKNEHSYDEYIQQIMDE